jgi:hypothetical protein
VAFEFVQDDNVESLGARFKRVRQEKELLLADVANDIKIHEKYLTAIEANDDSLFPDQVFKELFIKAYAEYLGIPLGELRSREPEPSAPATEPSKTPAKPTKPQEIVNKPPPIKSYQVEEEPRSGRRSLLVLALVIVIVVLGFFLVKLTFDPRTPAKVVIPEAIPKSVPKKLPTVDSTAVVADSTDTTGVADSLKADSTVVDSTEVVVPPDSVLLLMVGKGRCWIRVMRDTEITPYEGMVRTNDTLWFSMVDSIYMRLGRGNAVDVFLNALPLKLVAGNDTSVVDMWITRDNYLKYVDSARLSP